MDLQLAKGVNDVPPEEKIVQDKIVNTIKETFEIYGFAPLETPILERYETLSAKFGAGAGSDALKETFKLTDQGNRNLGLRFELTTSLGRYMAMNPNLKLPFKRYEVGPVFRDGPIKLGRSRQFWQCDADIIGTKSMLAEAEILALTTSIFKKLRLEVVIKVNNRKLLNGILTQSGIKNPEKAVEAIIIIDKLDKIGPREAAQELENKGFSQKIIQALFNLLPENATLKDLTPILTDPEGKEGLQELEELFSYLRSMKLDSVKFDVSLARGLGYYTGTVYEVVLPAGPISSSLAGGGRWDKMIGKFRGGEGEVPAVGIALGLVPIMEVMKTKLKLTVSTPAVVYVIPISAEIDFLPLVQQLRDKGIKTSFSLGKKGVSKNLEYASSLGIPYVIIVGEREIKENKVLLRDMDSGMESQLSLSEAIKRLNKSGLNKQELIGN
ncbi:MAG TPA: histidine--tRNA ligase [Candidatus Nanoarchaeia archaeon]|nr:histidine--tRNA ligase [Candidatus Nanoarchaeia archaeon]